MRPWLLLPVRVAHDLAPLGLELGRVFLPERPLEWRSFAWSRRGRILNFRNRLGTAGGVDKDGRHIAGWRHFGAGFVEIGTVTPLPQGPNPGRIIDRDVDAEALWNRMGFPGHGAAFTREFLREWRNDERLAEEAGEDRERFPVLVNIGKNRDTALADASRDYVSLIEDFRDLADTFVINISSPNTKGLRDLFRRENFFDFLKPIAAALDEAQTPGLLKLSPDLDDASLCASVDVAVELGLDGFVATNTTLERAPGLRFPVEGGVSGAPLKDLSRASLKKIIDHLGPRRESRLIISAGGAMTPDEVFHRLDAGADLVEAYSALVFSGPGFLADVAANA